MGKIPARRTRADAAPIGPRGRWLRERFSVADDPAFDKQAADVIIALGEGTMPDGRTPTESTRLNAERAGMLWPVRAANILLIGRGRLARGCYSNRPEAIVMTSHIGVFVPPHRLFRERMSDTTHDQALHALHEMRLRQWKTAYVVAEAWHARRVRACFRRTWAGSGCEFRIIRTFPESYASGRFPDSFWRLVLYEIGATAWYALRRYIW